MNIKKYRALLLSLLSIALCCAMLVGATFAWFTDSVSAGKNVITAGNLDIELEYSFDMKTWQPVEGRSDLVDPDALWEPGHTEVVYLRLSNKGTLALKYRFSMTVRSERGSVNVAGESFLLSDHLLYGITAPAQAYADRGAAVRAVKEQALPLASYGEAGQMLPEEPARVLALVVYMPESVDNRANYRKGEQRPEIELGVELFATQLENEYDSFGKDYDAGAPWTGETDLSWYDPAATEFVLTTEAQLAGFSALTNGAASTYSMRSAPEKVTFAGKTVKLGADMDLAKLPWTPVGHFAGTFDGQGHTVANVKMEGTECVAFFGDLGGTVKNLTLKNVEARGTKYVAPLAGYMCEAGGLENCHVDTAVVVAAPVMTNGVYDDGQHAGGLAAYADSTDVTGCSVTKVQVSAYRDLGGLVGTVTRDTANNKPMCKITGCSGTDIELSFLTAQPYADGKENGNKNLICGRGEAEVDDQTLAGFGEAPGTGGEIQLPQVQYYEDYVGHYYRSGEQLQAGGLQFDTNEDSLLCILQIHDFVTTRYSLTQRPVAFEGQTYYHEGAGFDPRHTEVKDGQILVYNSLYEENDGIVRLRIRQQDEQTLVVTESSEPSLPEGTLLQVTRWYISAPETGVDYAGNYRMAGGSLICSGVRIDVDADGTAYCVVAGHDFSRDSMGTVIFEGETYSHRGAGFEPYAMTYENGRLTAQNGSGQQVLALDWDPAQQALVVADSSFDTLPVGTTLTFASWN